ncbi:hypothetical protein C6I20_00250 [Aeromicrobium sp. A1-2]|uniref:hypothetical protein n=1 Tax=Aeromicrobium sp. A1-2 TaxID=2107713 RepID=UPI000E47316C|nr:hypothetical protein [Aeromicrobium sp. A1-2]AXT83780.1 hypothetical protein C6I20_00250 [Aeromicrobium sp. A1-2]
MTQAGRVRPPKLLTVCLYLGLVFALQVINVFVELADWTSLDGQARLKRWTAPMVDEGMTRADAETALRVAFTIIAIVSAAGLVFAVYTALGHWVSRIMLSIVGPIVAVYSVSQASFVGTIQGVVIFACLYQVWTPDVRAWFAAKNGKPLPAGSAQPAPVGTWPPPMAQAAQPGTAPSEAAQSGTDEADLPAQPGQARAPQPAARPRQDVVKVWSMIILILSSLVAMGCGAFLVAYEVARDEMVRQQVESGANWMNLSAAEVRDTLGQLAVLSWIVLPMCLLAIGASIVLLLRRGRQR